MVEDMGCPKLHHIRHAAKLYKIATQSAWRTIGKEIRIMSVQRSSITVFSSQFIFTIAGFLSTMYFARVLGAETLGVYFTFFALLNVLVLFTDGGMGGGTIKRISEGKEISEFFTASLLMYTIALIIAVTVIYFFSYNINNYVGADIWFFLILMLFLSRYLYLFRFTLVGEKKVGTSSIINVLGQITRILFQVLFIRWGYELYGLFAGLLIGTFIQIPVAMKLIRSRLKRPNIYHIKSIFSYSKYAFGVGFNEYLYQWMDLLVISLLLAKLYSGVYGTCWSLSTTAVFASSAISSTLFPYVSGWSSNNKIKEIENALSEGIAYSLMLAIPIFAGTLILSRELLFYAYGSSFEIGWLTLIILTSARLVEAVQSLIRGVLSGINRPDLVFKITYVTIPLNLIANFILVYTMGMVGAAIATFLTVAVSLKLSLKYVEGTVSVKMPWNEIKAEFLSSAVMSMILLILLHCMHVDGALMLGTCIALGAIIYFAMLLYINEKIRTKSFSLILEIINKIF